MPYTLGLLGSLPRLDQSDEPLTPIRGAPPSLINLPPGCPFSPRCPLAESHCDEVEPELRPIEGYDHVVACHRAEELSGDVRATEVFEVATSDEVALDGDAVR
jgi:oligopeptide/dipeptide ABC transporter ATP-binding protein